MSRRYDAVTTEGRLRWQNALTNLNGPFLDAADSIFLNYWWRKPQIDGTMSALATMGGRRANEVVFGLDVFGRGQLGGGGFDSWISLDLVLPTPSPPPSLPSLPSSTSTPASASRDLTLPIASSSPPFSLALFAPGWTVESEHLKHTLSTPEGYTRWLADEHYLWTGSAPTANVSSERQRMLGARKEERGVQQVRSLAAALSRGINAPPLPPFDYHSPLPPLPGTFRPIASYGAPRPPPTSTTFYTNFASGSGHGFFVEGDALLDRQGWTNVDFTFPFPSLLLPSLADGASGSLHENDGWMGPVSLRLATTRANLDVPIARTSVALEHGSPLRALAIWKPLEASATAVDLVVGSSGDTVVYDSATSSLANGWRLTSALVVSSDSAPTTITSLGLSLSSPSTILVGSLSLAPAALSQLPQPTISRLHWDRSTNSTRWTVSRTTAPSSSTALGSMDSTRINRDLAWPTFLFYAVWHFPEKESPSAGAGGTLLGVVSGTEFELGEVGKMGEGRIVVRGVREDGSMVAWGDASLAFCK